jgi:predicted PurR-regulated permease PerM
VGSRAVEEANRLSVEMPKQFAAWTQRNIAEGQAPNASTFLRIRAQVIERAQQEFAARSNDVVGYIFHAGVKVATLASSVLHVVIIPILAFFFLKDGRAIRHHILAAVDDGPRRTLLDGILSDIDVMLAQYMRALVILALATAIIYGLFFSIIGMPYSVLLAAVAGVLEFIPMIGPLSAGVVIVTVALFSGSHALLALVFLLVYRLFQDYVLQPHLMSRGVELHPLLVLFGVFAGAEIAGIPGTFLSVPALALARVFYLRMARRIKQPVEVVP